MRVSNFPLATLKETPADAEIVSHKLMLRAGLIRRLAAGLYTWLPLGLKVLRNVERVIREEMDRSGAIELLMPTVQPAELWQDSGRWDKYGPLLLKIKDRHQREFCYGPTHEEVITDFARREFHSYKQLPVNYYQIQTKFRDEIRPRFGVMRAREFLMKDAYSFHMDKASLQDTYDQMYETYVRIFERLGLEFRAVQADSGAIGGNASHEFHVLADSGEDAIAFSDTSDYAANIEKAETLPLAPPSAANSELEKIATPSKETIEDVSQFLKLPASQCIKTLLVKGDESTPVIALLVRGDHELNEIKALKIPALQEPLTLASDDEIKAVANCLPGSIGPHGLDIPIFADYSVMGLSDFVCGANEDGYHYTGMNWGRDLPKPKAADLRNVIEGDPSPDGKGKLSIQRGIEVGHIFQLGDRYSKAMELRVLDENGKNTTPLMGCYGIGVSRIVAAAIEQNHDDWGIIWPTAIAPFQVAIIPINMHKSQRLREAVDTLYDQLQKADIKVLLDDRKTRPGVMFADMGLIGMPHRIVFSERGLDESMVEYKGRSDKDSENIALEEIIKFLQEKIDEKP